MGLDKKEDSRWLDAGDIEGLVLLVARQDLEGA